MIISASISAGDGRFVVGFEPGVMEPGPVIERYSIPPHGGERKTTSIPFRGLLAEDEELDEEDEAERDRAKVTKSQRMNSIRSATP